MERSRKYLDGREGFLAGASLFRADSPVRVDPGRDTFGRKLSPNCSRTMRRRCKSEGLERSPYNIMNEVLKTTYNTPNSRPNTQHKFSTKDIPAPNDAFISRISYFPTLNNQPQSPERYNSRTSHDFHHDLRSGYRSPPLSPKARIREYPSPTHLPKPYDQRLPRVEEFLEKMDYQLHEPLKQPLKSILNNRKSPVTVTKKSKHEHPEVKHSEPKRRPRAVSETNDSAYIYNQKHGQNDSPRVLSPLSKKANHNNGVLTNQQLSPQTNNTIKQQLYQQQHQLHSQVHNQSPSHTAEHKHRRPSPLRSDDYDTHILRTTRIANDDTFTDQTILNGINHLSQLNGALPAGTNAVVKKITKKVKRVKRVVKMKSKSNVEVNGDTKITKEVSDWIPPCPMDTDPIIKEAQSPYCLKHEEKRADDAGDQSNNVNRLTNALSKGAILSRARARHARELALLQTINPFKSVSSTERPSKNYSNLSCFRMSLFPRVPPYLKFAPNDSTVPIKPPQVIQKHLKWKVTTITPIVVKKTLLNSGFKLMKSDCDTAECPQDETLDWIGIWGKHMKSVMFRAIKDCQKMNHFPGTFQIGRKDRLWRNLQKMTIKYGAKEFGLMPKTYVLPHDLKILKHDWDNYAASNEKWIIKPPASARGTGIKVISRWTQIPKKRPLVVQHYISKPYLINGSKFDLRLYVLVTSIHPLRIYLFKDGLARFASVKYNEDLSTLNDRYMHLTNYSINRLSKNYTTNEDASACQGHKWTLHALFQYLKTEHEVDTDLLWCNLKDLVIKTIISGEASITSLTKANVQSRYSCYELFGIDVLLDEQLKPWLLEVNISPSLHSASPLDIHVKGPVVSSVLNAAQFHLPPQTSQHSLKDGRCNEAINSVTFDRRLYTIYLSKEERDKHIIFTKMEDRNEYLDTILSSLTPDDVRHLIQAEDEYTQGRDTHLERIFPTVETHKYLGYLNGPRYYNRLFDAWENRYRNNREAGIQLLTTLCDIGYHLEVPTVPLKNDIDSPEHSATDVTAQNSTDTTSLATATVAEGDSISTAPPATPVTAVQQTPSQATSSRCDTFRSEPRSSITLQPRA